MMERSMASMVAVFCVMVLAPGQTAMSATRLPK